MGFPFGGVALPFSHHFDLQVSQPGSVTSLSSPGEEYTFSAADAWEDAPHASWEQSIILNATSIRPLLFFFHNCALGAADRLRKTCWWTCWEFWPTTASRWRSLSFSSACCKEKEACGWVTAGSRRSVSVALLVGLRCNCSSERTRQPIVAWWLLYLLLFVSWAAEARRQNVVCAESDAPETRPRCLLQLPRSQRSSKQSMFPSRKPVWNCTR